MRAVSVVTWSWMAARAAWPRLARYAVATARAAACAAIGLAPRTVINSTDAPASGSTVVAAPTSSVERPTVRAASPAVLVERASWASVGRLGGSDPICCTSTDAVDA